MRLFKVTLGAMALLMGTTMANAQETRAVIIANGNYDTQRDVSDADDARGLSGRLDDLGFEVSTYRDRSAGQMRSDISAIGSTIDDSDTLLVVLAGHTVGNDRDSWFLATDAPAVDGLSVGMNGLALSALSDAMAEVDGEAVLLIGTADEPARVSGAIHKMVATGALDPAVTGFIGPIDDLTEWAEEELLQPGATYADAIRSAPRSVRAFGDLAVSAGLVPEGAGNGPDELEQLLYERAELLNSETAFEDYLDRYPDGFYVDEARAKLRDLRRTPAQNAEDAEAALNLNRSERQTIQADLVMLGYNTNGVDGIFGQGTRRAITRWQTDNDRTATGFLSSAEITLIAEQAVEKKREIEAQDAALWNQARDRNTRSAYENYLNEYPNGLFVTQANAELKKIEDRAWNGARDEDTAAAYRAFLEEWPNGTHAAEARAKLNSNDNSASVAAAQKEEQQLLANPITRLLAEQRLAQLGTNPGVVDGAFDDQTRAAIKQYQQNRGLTAHGYIDRLTAASLLTN